MKKKESDLHDSCPAEEATPADNRDESARAWLNSYLSDHRQRPPGATAVAATTDKKKPPDFKEEMSLHEVPKTDPVRSARLARIAHTIETQLRSDLQACNDRDFSRLLRGRPPDWRLQFTRRACEDNTLSLEEWVRWIRGVAETFPNWKVWPLSLATVVNEDGGRAECFVNLETEGMEEGLRRRSVLRFEYRDVEGTWMLVSYRAMAGMEPEAFF